MNQDSVTFSRISSDGEEGYPGNLTIQATYGLNDDNEIHLNVTATTDKATIINITNHSYFNLAGQVILKSSNAFSMDDSSYRLNFDLGKKNKIHHYS